MPKYNHVKIKSSKCVLKECEDFIWNSYISFKKLIYSTLMFFILSQSRAYID